LYITDWFIALHTSKIDYKILWKDLIYRI
jgi:hypothetical protein